MAFHTYGAGGGSSAPTDATYVTLSTNATLTNERVLTAGSQITITDAGAGGAITVASPFFFDATVGATGADYTTVKGAIDAGKARILVIANTTETANTVIPGASLYNVTIYIKNNVNLDMGLYRFTDTGTVDYIYVRGEGTITYAHTSANEELFDLSTGTVVDIDGISIINNSTQSGCTVALTGSTQRIQNVTITLPNLDRCGIRCTAQGQNYFNNIIFTGGGNACTRVLDLVSVDCPVSGIIFNNTFKATSASSTDAGVVFERLTANNIMFRHGTAVARLTIGAFTEVFGVDAVSSTGVDVYCSSSVSLTNFYDDDGTLIAGTNNLICNANFLAVTPALSGKYSNVLVNTTALTVGNDFNQFTNCEFTGGATVSSGADNNGFVNSQFGGSGGGALTITIAAGSNNTRVVGCLTDAAISDAGTGTVLSANVVY